MINIKIQKRLLTRGARRQVTISRYRDHKSHLVREGNQPVMFVRAPKHFKSGKQHIFFFNSVKIKQYRRVLRKPLTNNFDGSLFFNLIAESLVTSHPDILISRITLVTSATVQFTWLVLSLHN